MYLDLNYIWFLVSKNDISFCAGACGERKALGFFSGGGIAWKPQWICALLEFSVSCGGWSA
jgi:hypothetical protein